MSERRLAIGKKVSLQGVADGWTDACYVVVTPISYAELQPLSKMTPEQLTESEGIKQMLDMIKKHIQGGKVAVLDEQDAARIVDIESNDLDALPPTYVNTIFQAMTGAALDPKDEDSTRTP